MQMSAKGMPRFCQSVLRALGPYVADDPSVVVVV